MVFPTLVTVYWLLVPNFMLYHYTAFDEAGKVRTGELEAPGTAALLQALVRQKLRPVSIREAAKASLVKRRRRTWFGQISLVDQMFLTKYLSLMLSVGSDLLRAVDALIHDTDRPILKTFLQDIRANLEAGRPFWMTFESWKEHFSPVFVSLIRSGETAGTLERVLADLSRDVERSYDLHKKIRSALTYPVLLLTASSLILILLLTLVIPRLSEVFASANIQPPLFTRIVLAISHFINASWPLLLILAFSGIIWLNFMIRSHRGRALLFRLFEIIPPLRTFLHRFALQRFASTLGSLLRGGVPILEALEITADAVAHERFRVALIRIARERVARGEDITQAFRAEPVFPSLIANLLSMGEKAGRLDAILNSLSTFYETEIDHSLRSLVTFLEPILLLGIGLIIGGIALAVIVPFYQFVAQF